MEIRQQHNLARLFAESFLLLNRCGGALLGYLVFIVLFMAVEVVLVAWLGVPQFLLKLANLFFSPYFMVVLFRIFAAKAERTDESVSNSFSAAVFPAVYQFVFNILYGIVWLLFIFLAAFLIKGNATITAWIMQVSTHTAGSSTYIGLALLLLAIMAVPLYVGVRVLYAPVAIALRDQGPIDAIRYSFQLTQGTRIFTALATMLTVFFFPTVLLGLIVRVGYITIPLYFADSFNLAQLSPVWVGVVIAIAIIYLAVNLTMPAFLVLVFLNQDYGHNRGSFTPQAELKLTSQQTQVFGANNNVLPPGIGNLVTPQDVANVEVVKSSVKAATEDTVTQQHLQQVYQPKPEDLVQYSEEEDRMPTILFDDDMARQIEQERAQWANKQQQDKTQKGEDDAPTIKMSK